MKIEISGQHVSITDGLRNHIEQKLSRIAQHNSTITSAHVALIVANHQHKAEIKMHVAGKELFASCVSGDDMYVAIDSALTKMNHQLVKHKEKRTDYRHESLKEQITG